MYGKLIDGALHIAPRKLPGDGVVVYNPPSEMYIEAGYKPVRNVEPPDDVPPGYAYELVWEENDEEIYQNWILIESLDDESAKAEAYDILVGDAV